MHRSRPVYEIKFQNNYRNPSKKFKELANSASGCQRTDSWNWRDYFQLSERVIKFLM